MDKATRQELDELTAYSVGNMLSIASLAAALVDAGKVEVVAVAGIALRLIELHPNPEPMMVTAIRQFLEMLASNEGPNGIRANLDFALFQEKIEAILKCGRRPDVD